VLAVDGANTSEALELASHLVELRLELSTMRTVVRIEFNEPNIAVDVLFDTRAKRVATKFADMNSLLIQLRNKKKQKKKGKKVKSTLISTLISTTLCIHLVVLVAAVVDVDDHHHHHHHHRN
jgi:hypothetical protein